jgi:N-acetylglucosaminyldiphosphoundecaprenol N-acetyl-beta-D-mannosaminyltransferase
MNDNDHSLLGLELNQLSLEQLVQRSYDKIKNRSGQELFACANPHSLTVMNGDPEFEAALKNTTALVADGVGVSLAGKLLSKRLGPRIAGNDYYTALLAFLDKQQRDLGRKPRIFFFGSSEKVLGFIAERFTRGYPGLELCGMLSPPFGDWSDEKNVEMVAEINAAKPDVLWVGMTAPKQEKWINANHKKVDVVVFGAIGAVFDFYAGTYERAPEFFCRMGLEWLFRLCKQPKRLWRRTFVSAPLFLFSVFKFHLFGMKL